ncbi:PP0621 family protein [Piscinibacterium candidicorallinum]|uniref:PP0621 family protein n=1 Tax=Piscinibacterium candidicorallinum TaxID=1793872 RepID=A0ABV7H904_9BURK
MGKIVLILILFFVIAYAIRRALSARNRDDDADVPPKTVARGTSERMLACQHCGAMTPMSAGVVRGGRFYCTEAHANKAQDA